MKVQSLSLCGFLLVSFVPVSVATFVVVSQEKINGTQFHINVALGNSGVLFYWIVGFLICCPFCNSLLDSNDQLRAQTQNCALLDQLGPYDINGL